MRLLHVCFCSYTLLTGTRVLYSVGNGNKSADALDENWRPAQLVGIAKRRPGSAGAGQLPGPCRLASGRPCDPVEQKDLRCGIWRQHRRSLPARRHWGASPEVA
jgi:hypothetical protein